MPISSFSNPIYCPQINCNFTKMIMAKCVENTINMSTRFWTNWNIRYDVIWYDADLNWPTKEMSVKIVFVFLSKWQLAFCRPKNTQGKPLCHNVEFFLTHCGKKEKKQKWQRDKYLLCTQISEGSVSVSWLSSLNQTSFLPFCFFGLSIQWKCVM